MKMAACFVLSALVLTGCSHSSTSTYDAADVGRTIDNTKASVIASRLVDISGETNAVGPVAGGVAGAAGTGLAVGGGSSTLPAAVLGGLVGAGAGYLTQKAFNNREGIEYTLQMEDGRTTTLVQNRETDEEPLPDGTPVLVQVSGQYTRVIADPTADRSGGGGGGAWANPDTQDTGGGQVAPNQRQ